MPGQKAARFPGSVLFVILGYMSPGLVGVEAVHLGEFIECLRPKVFFINNAILADDEGLNTGYGVLGGTGNQSKASDHYIFHHKVHLPKWRVRALPFEHFEKITMVGIGAVAVALLDRLSNLLADRAAPGAVGVLPGQAILPSRCAHDALGILVDVITLARLHGIFILRLHVTVADLNGIQFVGADATVKEFLHAGLAIEGPFVSGFHKRDGKWPVFAPHQQKCSVASLRIDRDAFLFVGLGGEVGRMFPVLCEFATKNNALTARSKHTAQSSHVKLVGRFDQSICSLLRSIKARSAR